jgi:hypothetical protein
MTKTSCRLGRLFCCLLMLGALSFAAEPNKTTITEAVFGSKTGNEKKNAALNFVASALSITEAVSQKEIMDQEKFREGLGQIVDGTVQCLNASAWSKAK